MFVKIKTNGATSIAIHVPHEGADKTLPAIAAMLEKNAVFINEGWRELKTVEPTMSIILGNKYTVENADECMMLIPENGCVLTDDFVVSKPEVHVSFATARKKYEDTINKQNAELTYLKQQVADYQEQIKALVNLGE